MRKYADFSCKSCAREYKDLPLDAKRCPVCGKARGFKRLFNMVQTSTKGHRVARYIDKRMQPAFDQHTSRQQSAQAFEGALKEVEDRIKVQGTPEQRQALDQHLGPNGMRRHSVPAAAAMSAIDPAARFDSAHYTYPATKRRVVPQWQR